METTSDILVEDTEVSALKRKIKVLEGRIEGYKEDLSFQRTRTRYLESEIQRLDKYIMDNRIRPVREDQVQYNRLHELMGVAKGAIQAIRETEVRYDGHPNIEPVLDDTGRVLAGRIMERSLSELEKMVLGENE